MYAYNNCGKYNTIQQRQEYNITVIVQWRMLRKRT